MVTLNIGDSQISLPMDYLTSVSSYFEKAFTGEFRKAKDKTLDNTVARKRAFAIPV